MAIHLASITMPVGIKEQYVVTTVIMLMMIHFFPGIQDITASVNFTAVAEAADVSGLDVLGYIEQGRFLMNSGIYDMVPNRTVEEQYSQAQQVKRLILPTEMGERFKVMALGRKLESDLLGFSHGDQLYRL